MRTVDGPKSAALEKEEMIKNGGGQQQLIHGIELAIDNFDIEKLLFCGGYQWIVFFAYQLASFSFILNLVYMSFTGYEASWTCESFNSSSNVTTDVDKCSKFEYNQCNNITWTNVTFKSIVEEWNLVCYNRATVYNIISIQMLGNLVGTPFISQISDSLGRKPAVLLSLLGQFIAGVVTGFAQTWQAFAVCRFFVGLFSGGVILCVTVFLVESVDKSWRVFFVSAGGVNLGFLVSTLIAWFCKDWRSLTIYGNLLGLASAILFCFLTESPRWLIQRGKEKRAAKSYSWIMRLNDKKAYELDNEQWNRLLYQSRKSKARPRWFWHLFSSSTLAVRTVIMSICLFTLNLISTTLLFSVDDLAGNIYINTMIFGFVRWSTAIAGTLIDHFLPNFGRKQMTGGFFSVILICLLGMTASTWIGGQRSVVKNVLLFIGAGSSSPVWVSLYLVLLEVYPTSMRSIATGFTSLFLRAGGVVTPQLLKLGLIWKPIPWIVQATLGLLFLVLFVWKIPETKGKPLIEEWNTKENQAGAQELNEIRRFVDEADA